MNIIKGKQKKHLRAVLYGVEGIGKTTFGSKAAKPLFIDVEGGSNHMDIDRIQPASYSEVKQIIANLIANTGGYQTLVIDTADWLEKLMQDHICKNNITGKVVDSIESFGYGKGWVMIEEAWSKLLDQLNRLKMDVLFLAHSEVKKFEQPEEAGAYDRYTLKMSKKGSAIIKEWPDLLLFAKYDMIVHTDENKKTKASGGQRRIMHTTHTAAWDAKNRFDLPEKLPLDFSKIAHLQYIESGSVKNATTAQTAMVQNSKPEAKPEATTTQQAAKFETQPASDNPKVKEVFTLLELSGIKASEVEQVMINMGAYPAGTTLDKFNDKTLNRLTSDWDAVKQMVASSRIEGLMNADGITPEQLQAEVESKGQGSGSYKEYSLELLEKLTTGWSFVKKSIKGE